MVTPNPRHSLSPVVLMSRPRNYVLLLCLLIAVGLSNPASEDDEDYEYPLPDTLPGIEFRFPYPPIYGAWVMSEELKREGKSLWRDFLVVVTESGTGPLRDFFLSVYTKDHSGRWQLTDKAKGQTESLSVASGPWPGRDFWEMPVFLFPTFYVNGGWEYRFFTVRAETGKLVELKFLVKTEEGSYLTSGCGQCQILPKGFAVAEFHHAVLPYTCRLFRLDESKYYFVQLSERHQFSDCIADYQSEMAKRDEELAKSG